MKRIFAYLFGLLGLLGLGGCNPFAIETIKPGITTASEVRERLGEPGMEWRNDDGSVTWEYSGQPQGIHCHMITVGPDRIVRAVDQVLNERGFARIQAGMDGDAVRRVLGKPASTQFFALSQERVWNWNVEPAPGTSDPLFFTVHFDTAGKVVRSSRNVQYRQ